MIPKTLKNFNLFVDGRGYAGRVEELTLPKLSIKTEEIRTGGMDAPVELDMGIEKLECDLNIAEYDVDIIALFGLENGAQVPLTLRGGLDGEDGVVPVVVTLRGAWRALDFGNWKAGEKAPLKVSVALRYYRLEIGARELIEIDAINMVRKIDGKDQLQAMRSALGI
ncbi:phage major tail tube protein [Exilibacterium tricleocarpae]|uniref:Phage major tail tube protein n=1 Tax=Exilibacterium tricleocarpae TaxID=2591008 RepID=A0A545T5Z2_9GAMM|nr:phage major tail tube protein [Exilibacterium tricleocarpae]TQV72582.1 phage major tail tube protein [Exilibacterium tricleocarpae]